MRKSLASVSVQRPSESRVPSIDPSLIYKNDLFGTVIEQKPPQVIAERPLITIPSPPRSKVFTPSQPQAPQFLPPLAITLKGIFYSTNELNSQVIIADNKTKKEALYKLGDKVQDAEIIHIDNHKVMFIRSNGQQETLFVTHDEAKNDQLYNQKDSWDAVVRKISDTEYVVYPELFTQRITNIAQFIDILDMTTAFYQGKSLGIRVGKFANNSIGQLLGLQQGDIITMINDMPTTSTKERVAIYNGIKDLDAGQTITVTIIRHGQEQKYQYVLQQFLKEIDREPQPMIATFKPAQQQISEESVAASATIEQVPQYINTIKKTEERDRKAMLNHGGRKSLLQQAPEQTQN